MQLPQQPSSVLFSLLLAVLEFPSESITRVAKSEKKPLSHVLKHTASTKGSVGKDKLRTYDSIIKIQTLDGHVVLSKTVVVASICDCEMKIMRHALQLSASFFLCLRSLWQYVVAKPTKK